MTTTTPYMSLVLPDVGITAGPAWATLIDAAYTLIDSHNHSTGQGVAITPSGLNISSDLSFASNNATNLRTARLYNNLSISLGVNDKTCLYALNNELYYIDGAGNTVQVTSGGTLNLAGGVSSLTLNDSAFILQYFGDTSRKFRFSAASIPASTSRIFTLPDNGTGNSTLVSIDATQTLTNKTFDSTSTATGIKIASLTSDGSHTLTFPTSTDTLVGKATTDTLTNKIITGNTAATLKPDGAAVLTLPVATDTLVGKATTDDLTNKSFNGTTVVKAANELRFNNSSNTFYTGLKAGANAASVSFTLPITDGSSGQVLSTNGSAALSWATAATTTGAVAANDSNVVFTNADNRTQVCTPTAARTYTMPTTSISAGDTWTFVNTSTTAANLITLQSSGSNTIDFVLAKGRTTLVALVSTPTTAANWLVVDAYSGASLYTPTYTGLGTVSAASTSYHRQGKFLILQGTVTAGTVAASLFSSTLPISVTIDSTAISVATTTSSPSPVVGYLTSAIGMTPILAAVSTSTSLIYCGSNTGGASGITPQNGSGPFGSNNAIGFFASIPISGWGG